MMACECGGVACRIEVYGERNKKRRSNEGFYNGVLG